MLRFAACLVVVGCTSRINPEYCAHNPQDVKTCGTSDASVDGPPLCLGADSFAVCVTTPTMPVTIMTDLDTDIAPQCAQVQPATWKSAGQPDACFVVGTTVTIQMVRAHGGRPLVAVASDSITVTGLDVSSTRTSAAVGAGYDPSVCVGGSLPAMSGSGGGGGAGGSFFGPAGGTGGLGNGNVTGGMPIAGTMTPPILLRGGCAGQAGGTGAGAGGAGGLGGGAVYLLATTQIDLTGATLNASGAGGGAGQKTAGGGGGGSGGMIVLHANTIGTNGATLLANGGGGGGGGAGAAAAPGDDPNPTMVTMAAAGGPGQSNGNGGSGFAGPNNPQPGTNGNGGCGGGGGGAGGGYIQTNHTLGTPMISPTPTMM
jgi:hypothetical protein